MTAVLTLPRLVAGRELAAAMVDQLGSLAGAQLIVDGRNMVTGTGSFAAGLIRRALIDQHAAGVVLVGAPEDFVDYAADAATKLGVAQRFSAEAAMPESAVTS
jgi:hypothetical protein